MGCSSGNISAYMGGRDFRPLSPIHNADYSGSIGGRAASQLRLKAAGNLREQMAHVLQVIVCQVTSCRTEIVLPFLTPLENFPLVASVGGDPYLHVA
jgi:hypothetical protein